MRTNLKRKSKLEIFKWGTWKTTVFAHRTWWEAMYIQYSCGLIFFFFFVQWQFQWLVGPKTITQLTKGTIVVIEDEWLHTFKLYIYNIYIYLCTQSINKTTQCEPTDYIYQKKTCNQPGRVLTTTIWEKTNQASAHFGVGDVQSSPVGR